MQKTKELINYIDQIKEVAPEISRVMIVYHIHQLIKQKPELSQDEAAQEILSWIKLKYEPVVYKEKHKPGSESWDVDSYNDFN